MKYILFIAMILTTQVLAQELDQKIEDQFMEEWPTDLKLSSEKIKEDLTEQEMEIIDDLQTHDKYYLERRKLPPIERGKRPFPTEPYKAYIKAKTTITDIKTNRSYTIPVDLIVHAKEVFAGGPKTYILDQDLKEKYIANARDVISIREVSRLLPTPAAYQEYPRREAYILTDSKLLLDNYINFHLEYVQDEYLKDLFISLLPEGSEVPDSFPAIGRRLEYKCFYKWQIPVEFGINLNYQEGSWQQGAKGLVWRSVFFGPVAQYNITRSDKNSWNVQMSYQKSLLYEASSLTDSFSFSYSTTALEFNLNYITKTEIGNILLGVAFRRAKASLNGTTVNLRRNPDRGNMDSISGILGYNFSMDWNL